MLTISSSSPTSILLVDDHPIIRFGFIALLKQFNPSFIFYETETAEGATAMVKAHAPRLAIVDLSLAGNLSLDLIKRMRRSAPDTAILVVSMHDEKLFAERVLRAGARGYVMKQLAAKTITSAVERVLDGKIWLSDDIREELVNRIGREDVVSPLATFQTLSDREVTVYALIGKGMKKSEIAKELAVSPNTVETYRANIKKKMGLASGAELYRHAFLSSQNKSSFSIAE